MNNTGFPLLAAHMLDLSIVLALLAICTSVGKYALDRAGFGRELSAIESLSFSVAIGMGFVALSILICGFLQILRPPVILAMLLFGGTLSRRQVRGIPRMVAESFGELRRGSNIVVFTLYCVILTVLVIHSLLPPTNWDSLAYHLDVPKRFLEAGGIYLPKDNLHTAFVGVVHMLYVPLLAFGSFASPALLNAFIAALLALSVFAFANRFLDRLTARLSLLLLWASTSVFLVAITPRIDVSLAFYLFLVNCAIVLSFEDMEGHRYFYLAAVLLGFGFGVKYTGLLYGLSLVPLVMWWALRRRSIRDAIRSSLSFGLIVVVFMSPWLAKNWWLLGSPIYPYMTEKSLPPWLEGLVGSDELPGQVLPEAYLEIGRARADFNVRDFFLDPGRLTVDEERNLFFANFFFLALPLAIFFYRSTNIALLLVPSVLYILILVLPFRINLRYLIPAFPALTIVSLNVAVRAIGGVFSPRIGRAVIICMVVLALVPTTVTIVGLTIRSRAIAYATGVISKDDYLANYAPWGFPRYWDVVQFTLEFLEEESRILLIFESRGIYFSRSTIQDDLSYMNWPLTISLIPGRQCLQGTGITHVLVNTGGLRYWRSRGVDLELYRWELFPGFAERCLRAIYRNPSFVLYRVEPSGLPPLTPQSSDSSP